MTTQLKDFVRPNAKLDTVKIDSVQQVRRLIPRTETRALQTHSITRPQFYLDGPTARHGIAFDRLRVLDITQHGIKVQVTDPTLKKLQKIILNDDTDVEWLRERARLKALGMTDAQLEQSPPLGREQRKETATGAKAADLDTGEFLGVVNQGLVEGVYADIDRLTTMVDTLIERLEATPFTPNEYIAVQRIAKQIGVPPNWEDNFDSRFITPQEWKEKGVAGGVTMYILSLVQSPQRAIVHRGRNLSIGELSRVMRSGDFKLDLEDGTTVSLAEKAPILLPSFPATPVQVRSIAETPDQRNERLRLRPGESSKNRVARLTREKKANERANASSSAGETKTNMPPSPSSF